MAERRWNIPNALGVFRLVGSFVLVGLALAGVERPFGWLLLALFVSDWIDGKLAIALDQRTTFGARLDSVADASMYGAALFGAGWLEWEFLQRQWVWVAAALGSYVVTTLAGWLKYGRVPSYHTRAAKTCWFLAGIAAVMVFTHGPAWPFRLAAAMVVATNLEATLMTLVLPRWRADVPSLLHAWRLRRALEAEPLTPVSRDGMEDQRE